MADVWFAIVSLLLAAYVVLDGFDLGAGAIHRIVARNDEERRAVIRAIGPFWDGNEVFLLAAGGALFVAFSKVVAAALSGLYLAVVLVLWALLLRGMALELRSHLRDELWRAFWDVVFQLSSAGVALLLGVSLGNVLRGFPLERDGYFALDLFSLRSPRLARAVVDAYTLSTGVLGVLVLGAHGGRFLAMRTEGALQGRCTRLANGCMPSIAVAFVIVSWLSWRYAQGAVVSFPSRPLAQVLLAAAAAAFALSWERGRSGHPRAAFLASALLVLALIGLAAASVYPVMLRSTSPDVPSMTVTSAASPDASLAAGLQWWILSAVLVVGYFANLFRVHTGTAGAYGEGGEHDVQAGNAPPSQD
jgi:cytochrome d ubiquinol oxidase subunit II